MKYILFTLILTSMGFCNVYAQAREHGGGSLSLEEVRHFFSPLPDSIIDPVKNKNLISLGKRLYFEKGLSVNNTVSCNSCHQVDNYGVDSEATSPGHEGKRGGRNSPTSFNAALHFTQFWDGRAKDVEEQALGPILNPVEMGMPSEKAVIEKLKKLDGYIADFKKSFSNETKSLTYKNVGVAIGAYERTLITPSRFDKYLKGDETALNRQEKMGLKKFIHKGCVSCHGGSLLGGTQYQKIGTVIAYPTKDLGRFEVTGKKRDKKKFKVPSLRNILKTGPYFHDGSIKTIDEAITLMAHHQLGERVGPGFTEDVKAFFRTLTMD